MKQYVKTFCNEKGILLINEENLDVLDKLPVSIQKQIKKNLSWMDVCNAPISHFTSYLDGIISEAKSLYDNQQELKQETIHILNTFDTKASNAWETFYQVIFIEMYKNVTIEKLNDFRNKVVQFYENKRNPNIDKGRLSYEDMDRLMFSTTVIDHHIHLMGGKV